jgi:hypothetical protein
MAGRHETFRAWAQSQNIMIHAGIRPTNIVGRGIGILATMPLKVRDLHWLEANADRCQNGEVLVDIPKRRLVTIDSEIAQGSAFPQDLSVHGTLAAALTLNSALLEGYGRKFVEWEATWPSPVDVSSDMPIFWERKLQRLLPPHARGLRWQS